MKKSPKTIQTIDKVADKIKHKKSSEILAFLLSLIFSPFAIISYFLFGLVYLNMEKIKDYFPSIIVALVFVAIIPALYLAWELRERKVKDFHLAKREDRIVPFTVGVISGFVGLGILYFMHAPMTLMVVLTVFLVNSLVLTIVTYWWKISFHSSIFVVTLVMAVIFFGHVWLWLFLLWIPVVWSRIYRKRHTIPQVMLGAVIAIFLTFIILNLFKTQFGG